MKHSKTSRLKPESLFLIKTCIQLILCIRLFTLKLRMVKGRIPIVVKPKYSVFEINGGDSEPVM